MVSRRMRAIIASKARQTCGIRDALAGNEAKLPQWFVITVEGIVLIERWYHTEIKLDANIPKTYAAIPDQGSNELKIRPRPGTL